MAATVTLTVELNDKGILTRLNELDAAANKLQGRKITIDVSGSNVSSAVTQLTNLSNAQARLATEAQRTAQAQAAAVAQVVAAQQMSQAQQAQSAAQTAQMQVAAQAQVQTAVQQTAQMQAAAQASIVASVQQGAAAQVAAEAQVQAAMERTTQAQLNLERAQVNADARNQASAARVRVQELRNEGAAAREAAGGYSALQVALGNIASRAFHFVLRKITQSFREAFTEMKNVDTQLTNISKVSGKTGEELAAIGDRAYDTASKYGEAASTYLASVYNMQKAGMGDQSEAMGELAIKTMLVGDTTEDVASKFLIASNAAWQLDGNMSRLTQIVDEADYINNNYATSLDKLAAGMPIVASIAAQTGMTAEETMAAIGTITAATQESGTKAATALRALILNISGQVGKYLTEEGEEFEVTEKSVKSMQGLLEKYAKTEMDAAKAAGQLIDPMTAIQAIFKGMKEDDLTDVELFNLLSGMGGKLRTNQLTALVQNFDTLYTDMMNGMKNAAGTADKEIDLMMNSWERKSQKLKNTWTEFIADIVETDTIKGGIDLLTNLISGLDDLVGKAKNPFFDSEQTENDIDSAKDKVDALVKAIMELRDSGTDRNDARLKELQEELKYQQQILETKQKQYQLEHEQEARKLQSKLKGQAPDMLSGIDSDAAGVVAGGNVQEYQQSLTGVLSKYQEYYDQLVMIRDAGIAMSEEESSFISYFDAMQAVATDTSLSLGNAVNGQREFVDGEGNVVAVARDGIKIQEEINNAIDDYNEKTSEAVDKIAQVLQDYDAAYADYAQAEEDKKSAKTSEERADAIARSTEAYERMGKAQKRINEYAEEQLRLNQEAEESTAGIVGQYDDAGVAVQRATENALAMQQAQTDATAGAGELDTAAAGVTGEIEAASSAAGGIDFSSATAGANGLQAALAEAAATAQSINVNLGGMGGNATGTKNAPGGPTLVNELGPELISENGRAYIANGGKPGVVNLSKGAIVLTARETRDALRGGNGAVRNMHAAAGGKKNSAPIVGGGGALVIKPSTGNKPSTPNTFFSSITPKQVTTVGTQKNPDNPLDFRVVIPTNVDGGASITSELKKRVKVGGNGTGGGGSTAKSVEDLAKETKDILSNLEKQAKLADNRKQYDKEASLYAQGQAEIDKMVAAYKKAGYKETDDEVLDLLNKRYDYEKKKDAASKKTIEEAAKELKDKLSNLEKQADVAEKQEDYLSQVKFYEQAQEAIKTMVDRYRKAGYKDDSDEILDLLKKNYDYADKQVSIYKDRWNDLIDALETDTEQQELANALAEKQQALEDARLSLENAQKQRTIRTYNAATGQWEWVRDEAKVKSAQESLTKAEKDYADEVKDQAIQEIEKMRDTLADLNEVVLGPALTSVMAMAESSSEFQNFARALNAVYGVGSYLSSTEGSSKVISTASDSHDTIYTFGNVTLTEEQASTMSVAQLAQKLQVLKIS